MTYTTIRKIFPVLIVLIMFVGVFSPALAKPAEAAANAGDLIRCPDFTATYYLGEDNKRYVFPNENTYYSYYENFSDVKWISCADLGNLPIGGNVPYRAGTRLIKMPSVPTTYAIEPGGVLRAIQSETQAQELFGNNWAQFVDDLSEAFFPTYELGVVLEEDELPEGMIISNSDDGELYVIWNDEAVQLDTELIDDILTNASVTRAQNQHQHRYAFRNANQGELSEYQLRTRPADIEEADVVTFSDIKELTNNEIWYNDEHVMGDLSKVQVIMIEYVDFECSYCARHHATMQQVMDNYGDDVAWIIRHFPLSFHAKAERAALASECAAEQGKFWEYAEGLFEESPNFDDFVFFDLAQDLGMNTERFIECYIEDEYQRQVDEDVYAGQIDGITGTPATIINGQKVMGAVPYSSIAAVIDEKLAE
ncbi:MAG: DsbA family protein [Patescibacteria group bacterium]